MYNALVHAHSGLRWVALGLLLFAIFNSIKNQTSGRYEKKDKMINLFAMVFLHIQLLIGLLLYFTSSPFGLWSDLGVGEVMKNASIRLYLVEHPTINILAVALITIGYSKHKKKLISGPKYKTIAVFYTIALLLILSRIPWNVWPN